MGFILVKQAGRENAKTGFGPLWKASELMPELQYDVKEVKTSELYALAGTVAIIMI